MTRGKLIDLTRMPKGADWSLEVSLARHGGSMRSRVYLKAYPVARTQTRELMLFYSDLRMPPPEKLTEALGVINHAVNAAIIYVANGGLSSDK